MAYRVIVAAPARQRFDDAVTYILNVLCAPNAAKSLVEAVELIIDGLKSNPSFKPVDIWATDRFGVTIYKARVKNYTMSYFIREDTREVVVFSFLHAQQNRGLHLWEDYESTDS